MGEFQGIFKSQMLTNGVGWGIEGYFLKAEANQAQGLLTLIVELNKDEKSNKLKGSFLNIFCHFQDKLKLFC